MERFEIDILGPLPIKKQRQQVYSECCWIVLLSGLKLCHYPNKRQQLYQKPS